MYKRCLTNVFEKISLSVLHILNPFFRFIFHFNCTFLLYVCDLDMTSVI